MAPGQIVSPVPLVSRQSGCTNHSQPEQLAATPDTLAGDAFEPEGISNAPL